MRDNKKILRILKMRKISLFDLENFIKIEASNVINNCMPHRKEINVYLAFDEEGKFTHVELCNPLKIKKKK